MNALDFTTQSLFMQKGSAGICFGFAKTGGKIWGQGLEKAGGIWRRGGYFNLPPPLKIGNSKGTIEFPR